MKFSITKQKQKQNKKILILYRKAIALSLAFLFLFNISAEAFININQLVPKEIAEEIRAVLSESSGPELTPKEYLKDLLENIEKAISDENDPKPNQEDKNEIPKKLTPKDYETRYKQTISTQYQNYNKEIENQALTALEEFDRLAEQEIANQEKLLESPENKQTQYTLFNTDKNTNNFDPILSYKIELDNQTRKQNNNTSQSTQSKNSLKLKTATPKQENPLTTNLYNKIKAGLKTNNEISDFAWQEYQFHKQAQEMEANRRKDKITKTTQKIEELKQAISEQRGLYEAEIATWKTNALKELETEKAEMIKKIPAFYNEYSKLYDTEVAKIQEQEIELYKDLIHKSIENYKKTAPNDFESKTTFLSILFYLTAIKGPGLDRNKFIVGEDRNYIKTFLHNNISEKKLVCFGSAKTEANYNSPSSTGLYGGSPSAGKLFDKQWANYVDGKTEFVLNTPNDCELAISSLIPYANLDGDGYVISSFIREYWNEGMFGAILPYAVKALVTTRVRGKEALSKFIDDAIKKENEVRNSHNGFWDTMNLITLEGFSNSKMFDGKYCEHNLCLSADAGTVEPNGWETVAQILAKEGLTDILKKATNQCKIVASNEDYRFQNLKCGGIYPLLFGALLYAPQLADSLQSKRPYTEVPCQELDRQGHVNYVSKEQANINKNLNDNFDLLKKYGKAELMMKYIMGQSFSDLHPANKMRMYNLIATSQNKSIFDPKNQMKPYSADSEIYKKELNKYNAKMIVWGVTSYGDWLIALLCTKDLARIAFNLAKITKVTSLIKALVKFKNVPMSFGKSVKLANLLKAKGITPKYINRVNKLRKIAKSPIQMAKSAVIERLGAESHAMIAGVSGKITGVRNGILIGTNEVFRPVSKSYKSTATYRQGAMGGFYSTHANNLPVAEQRAQEVLQPAKKLSFREKIGAAWAWINPKVEGKKHDININTENLTLQVFNKKGKPIKIEKISIEDGILHINEEMFKTFKATLPEEQLTILNQIVKKHNIPLGIKGIYVKPTWKNYKPNMWEKFQSKNTISEIVDVYDETGKVIMQIGFDRAYAPEAALLERLGVMKPKKANHNMLPKKTTKARLIYFDNALYIEEGANLVKVEGLEGFAIPKTAICNATKGGQSAFLTDLFSMPGKTSATQAPLKFSVTGHKVRPIFLVNMLSYSAASSGLLLTLEQEPFNLESWQSVSIGLAAPYIWSFTAPLFAPLVSKWGARTFLNSSLGIAALGIGIALKTGYRGQSTYQTDENGRVLQLDDLTRDLWLKDEEKKHLIDKEGRLYRTKEQRLPVLPLFFTSLLTGLAASGVRASSNVILKGYEINKATLTKSMFFKNIGGMTFTLTPFIANSFAKGIHSEKLGIDIEGTGKFKDFSFAYPVILGLTLATIGVIRAKMPKLAVPGYKFSKPDFVQPWRLLTNPKIWPYIGGTALTSSLEGYVLFKGVSTFEREMWQDPYNTPNNPKDDLMSREDAKFLGAFCTALPQIILRLWSPRKALYGRGLFNSTLLATAGAGLLLLPSPDKSIGANVALGLTSGFMLGFGTANVFQYSQKLIISQADLLTTIPNARRDAQILYSMTNLGFALPFFFGMDAERKKTILGENEFDATRHTFHWPVACYVLGMGLILDAERNASRVSQGFTSVTKNLLLPVKYLIKPTLKYGSYIAEGNILTQQFRNYMFSNLKPSTNVETPKLNINTEQLELNILDEEKQKKLDFIFEPLPQVPQFSPAFSGEN